MPPPPGPEPSDDSHAVWDWYREVQSAPFQPGRFAASLADHQAKFKKWVVTEPGLAWFHHAAERAWKGEGDARRWIDKLTSESWCECWPRLVARSQDPVWPTECSTQNSPVGVTWKYSSLKEGRAVAVERFAPKCNLMKATFSLGPEQPDRKLGYADAIREAARAFPGLQKPAENIYIASRDAARVGCGPVFKREGLVVALIDPLPKLATGKAGTPDLAELDRLLVALRGWCGRSIPMEILPANWSFGNPAMAADAELSVQFSDAERGSVHLYRLGLAETQPGGQRRVIRAPSWNGRPARSRPVGATCSPGSARGPCRAIPSWSRTSRSGRGIQLQDPDGLRAAAMELFERFWQPAERGQAEMPEADAAALEVLLASLGLRTFRVNDTNRYRPDEVKVRHGQRRTGIVVKVIRPGLRSDAADRLGAAPTFPAIVVTE